MFDNLLDLVKQHAGDAIINNPAIPNERNDEAVQEASSSIFDGLKNAVSGGNISDVMNLFQGGNDAMSSSPVAQNIQSGFIQNLMNKFGLDKNAAGGIAGNLIPQVLQKFVHKTNDPNDSSFDLQGILSKVGGGNLDIQSLIGKFTDGGNTANTTSGGGGILDTIKGLFGK
jgi:uncharacterized protein YidB (DUF937 family)